MAAKKNAKKYRFVLAPTPLPLTFVLLITLLVSVVFLSVLGSRIKNYQGQTDALRHYAGELEEKIDQLEDKLDQLGTVDSIKDIAGDELGYVDPDAIVIPVE